MATFSDLDLSGPLVIVSHGGCPDGALSALMLVRAVRGACPEARVQVSEAYHSEENASGVNVDADTTLCFVDISPTEKDLPKLKAAKRVVVLDHHKSAVETMATLSRQVPAMVDLSNMAGEECGASLVQAYVGSAYRVPPRVLELAWKLDVYEHELAPEHAPFFDGFRGWVKVDGERKTSVKRMEELVDDFDASIARGKELFEKINVHTQQLFNKHRIVHEQAGFRIALVDVSLEDRATPVDFPGYQALIDKLVEPGRATIFATASREILPNGSWNLGLRRAGPGVDVGKIAAALAKTDTFVAGGGHPFAAGAQCPDPELSQESLIVSIARAAEQDGCLIEAIVAQPKLSKTESKAKAKAKAKSKAEAKAKAKAKANVQQGKSKPKYRAKAVLYTNAICPFAHRAVFAAALCHQDPKIVFIPLSGQLKAAEIDGMRAVPAVEPFKDLTVEQLNTQKEDYKRTVNASGEVPSLRTTDAHIIIESEIIAEFFGRTSNGKLRLMPSSPVLAAKVQLAMKRFNDVVGPSFDLLTNQDPAADAEHAKAITGKLARFADAIDKEGLFCFGDKPTLADVHCGPFLYRFKLLLEHYRGFDLFADQLSGDRLPKLLAKIAALPEFQKLTPVTDEALIHAYHAYANGTKYTDGPTKEALHVGRGKAEFGK